jgi:hypothetical protein
MNEYLHLSYDAWFDTYKPVLSSFGDVKDYDYDEARNLARSVHSNRLWTLLDCDGQLVIANGWHYVNRLGYHMTELPFKAGITIEVYDEDDNDDENSED